MNTVKFLGWILAVVFLTIIHAMFSTKVTRVIESIGRCVRGVQ